MFIARGRRANCPSVGWEEKGVHKWKTEFFFQLLDAFLT